MLPQFIKLIGRLINKYDVMSDIKDFDEAEKDILRLAQTEYTFYHAHELPLEAGQDPSAYINVVKEQVITEDRKREVLSLKRKASN